MITPSSDALQARLVTHGLAGLNESSIRKLAWKPGHVRPADAGPSRRGVRNGTRSRRHSLSALVALGHGAGFSPEAWAAVEPFDASLGRLGERMHNRVGGRELTSKGFGSDVAADLNSSSIVPVLTDGAFDPAD